MKNLVIGLCLFILSACEKDEVKPEKTWYLDFAAPALTYPIGNLPADCISDNMGADGKKVGITIDFKNERFKCRVFMEGEVITQITGVLDGHPFGVHGNFINVCGGVQNSPITYNLKFQ